LTGPYSLAGADALAGSERRRRCHTRRTEHGEARASRLLLDGYTAISRCTLTDHIATPDGVRPKPVRVGELRQVIASRVAEAAHGSRAAYLLNPGRGPRSRCRGQTPQTVTRWVQTVSTGLSQRWNKLSQSCRARLPHRRPAAHGARSVASSCGPAVSDGGSGAAGPDGAPRTPKSRIRWRSPPSGRASLTHLSLTTRADPLGLGPSANRISALPGSGGVVGAPCLDRLHRHPVGPRVEPRIRRPLERGPQRRSPPGTGTSPCQPPSRARHSNETVSAARSEQRLASMARYRAAVERHRPFGHRGHRARRRYRGGPGGPRPFPNGSGGPAAPNGSVGGCSERFRWPGA